MKILLIKDEIIHDIFSYDLLLEFAEPKDIDYIDNAGLAKNFIIKKLIGEKKFIDLILIQDSSFNLEISTDFIEWFKNLSNETYFFGYFKIDSIPVILYHNLPSAANWRKFNIVLNVDHSERIFKDSVGKVITNWRQQLAADLNELDLDLTLNYKKTNLTLAYKRLFKLKIITKKFLDDRFKLDFIWFGNKLDSIDISLENFNELIKKHDVNKNFRGEKEIHEFFNNNTPLIKGEYNIEPYYEKHFYLNNSRKYVEPDFINIPFSYTFDLPEIFEVKLPNHQISKKNGTDLLQSTKNYIHQVTEKYYDYFSSKDNKTEILKRINYPLNTFDYTLLIGKKSQLEENQEYLNNFIGNSFFLQLISYDELVERFERLYDRTKKFMIE